MRAGELACRSAARGWRHRLLNVLIDESCLGEIEIEIE
jgi:hypothetical protein